MDKTVLVIDNDEALVDIESFYFSEQGYTVYTAFDGDVGLKLALQHKPAAIVCDLIMGEMHGFEVLRKLRENPDMKHTVVIMTSAKAYKPDIDRARDLGATDYVVKPFRTDELLALIERHLGSFGQQEDH
jgi:two-component system, OmpR family, response regulator VicR